jgi:hypothetical protein
MIRLTLQSKIVKGFLNKKVLMIPGKSHLKIKNF